MRRIVFLILVLGLLVSFGNQGWIKLINLKRFEQALQRENIGITNENQSLKAEVGKLKTQEYLEHFIRDELGFVKDDEVVYEISSTDARRLDPQ